MTTISFPSVIESFVDKPKALFIFAHGAGADKSHRFMENFALKLNEKNINVVRFNFPYMDKRLLDGRKYPPNRMPQLEACYRLLLEKYIHSTSNDIPIFIGGKSMGGRVAATLSKQAFNQVKGTICIGYPFHPQKKPENLRLAPLQGTVLPILILQGDRDALGNKEEIENYALSTLCEVVYFTDGDHDLKPRVKSGYTQDQHLKTAVEQLARFIHEKS